MPESVSLVCHGYAKEQGRESVTATLPGRSSLPEKEHAPLIEREVSAFSSNACVFAIAPELDSSAPALFNPNCFESIGNTSARSAMSHCRRNSFGVTETQSMRSALTQIARTDELCPNIRYVSGRLKYFAPLITVLVDRHLNLRP